MPDTRAEPIVTGVDFVSVFATDLERARTFYGEVLGLPCTVDRAPYNLEFDTGNLTLSVLDAAQMKMTHHVNPTHIALQVADMATARAHLEAHGVTFDADTLDTGVCHMAFFNDPDGNAFMLHHRYAPKVQAPAGD